MKKFIDLLNEYNAKYLVACQKGSDFSTELSDMHGFGPDGNAAPTNDLLLAKEIAEKFKGEILERDTKNKHELINLIF